MVGRHLRRSLPEIPVLRLIIDEQEADRRHRQRANDTAQTVRDRNRYDAANAVLLGTVKYRDNVSEVDVTDLTQEEQADVLRQFIRTLA